MPLTSRGVVIAVLAALVAAIVAAPVMGPGGAAVYAAFGWVCHQEPERSWELTGRPLAVCVRCLGLYLGALAGSVVGLRFWRGMALGMLGVVGVDWLVEAAGYTGSRPWWRFGIGLVVGALVVPALYSEPRGQPVRRMG